MTGKPRDPSKLNPEQAARQARLNVALRANIRRRKDADASRTEPETGEDEAGTNPPSGPATG